MGDAGDDEKGVDPRILAIMGYSLQDFEYFQSTTQFVKKAFSSTTAIGNPPQRTEASEQEQLTGNRLGWFAGGELQIVTICLSPSCACPFIRGILEVQSTTTENLPAVGVEPATAPCEADVSTN